MPHSADPIVAIATAAGRGAVGIVRVSGHDLAPLVVALCGRMPPPRAGHLPAVSRRRRRADRPRPGDLLPGAALVHRRGRPRAAGARRPGRAAAAARALPRGRGDDRPGARARRPRRPAHRPPGRVHRARLRQRQARPGPGRGRRRPDRRQHRGGGALGGALARRCVLERDRGARRDLDRAARAGRGDARLPRRGDRLPRAPPTRAAGWRARPSRSTPCWRGRARARCCATASRSSSPASRTSARARSSTRSPAPSSRSSRRRRGRHATRSARRSRSTAFRSTSSTPPACARAADEVETHRRRPQLGRDRARRRDRLPARPDPPRRRRLRRARSGDRGAPAGAACR